MMFKIFNQKKIEIKAILNRKNFKIIIIYRAVREMIVVKICTIYLCRWF